MDSNQDWKAKHDDLQAEFDEFRHESLELEAALEKEVKTLTLARDAVKRELDDLKTKVLSHQTESNKTINILETELEALRKSDVHYKNQIRELEITNTDLQTSLRAMESSSHDYETQYNKSLEQITLLMHDLEAQKENNQRLRDESRDLKEEISNKKPSKSQLESKLWDNQTHRNTESLQSTGAISREVSSKLIELTEKAKSIEARISQAREKIVAPMLLSSSKTSQTTELCSV
ncbi:hypothetical protein SeMB42_g02385 [Synchytrium endobioticum]|uniref:NUDE domain-containing protein n=1 Tax=Synchytrium endobioticum TaxID=286115 RepID=A0A507D7U1_9FUNG|nr:hypothetical protein SeLEV6574_g02672 [Synchytrium endobioticum]TPX50098.1 hypothetical protein SeMB42_g02385 [Synchytrium endobioticum]